MVEGILVDHPEVLVHPARKILNLVTMVVELSDFPPTYFDVKWTLKEYEEELAKPIE